MRVLRALPFIAVIALAGCGKFFVPNTGGGGGCTTNCSTTDFMYVANQNQTTPTLAAYSFASGSLAAVTTTPYTLTTVPSALAINPANTFLYLGGLTNGSIYEYGINSNGTLTAENTGNPVASIIGGIASMKVDSTGGFLIVANAASASISVFSIDSSSGALTQTTGSPVTLTQGNPTGIGTQALSHLLITPNNQLVYVSEGTAGVDILSFASATGTLTETGHLAPLGTNNSDQGLASDPNSAFLFVTETGVSGVRVLSIDTTGALHEVTGSPFPTGLGPSAVLVDLTGTYVYVTNRTDGTISGFSLTATTGALTALNGSPFAVGIGTATNLKTAAPLDITEDNTKTFVSVVNNGGNTTNGNFDLQVFKFSATTPGALVAFDSATTGTDPTSPVALVATH
jgi:6-phosphogluconolactonase